MIAHCTYEEVDPHSLVSPEPGKFYKCIYYFDLNTNTCKSSLVIAKVQTSHPPGVYVLDEAYGLSSNRKDGADGQPECVICLTEMKNVITKPCRHVCMCYSCAQALMAGQQPCPMCRQPISDVVPFQL